MRIVIPSYQNYGTIEHNYIAQYTCLASDNEFIPVFVLPQGELVKNSKGKEFIYSLYHNLSILNVSRFNDFCEPLQYDTNWTYKINRSGIEGTYYSSNNRILYYDEAQGAVKPLLLVCVKQKYLYTIDRQNPNPSQFCIVIDNKFINDESHFGIYRNVKKNYLDVHGTNIDVMFTNDIMRLCFNHKVIEQPKFKTIPEMMQHTKDLNRILEVELQENNI